MRKRVNIIWERVRERERVEIMRERESRYYLGDSRNYKRNYEGGRVDIIWERVEIMRERVEIVREREGGEKTYRDRNSRKMCKLCVKPIGCRVGWRVNIDSIFKVEAIGCSCHVESIVTNNSELGCNSILE